MLPTTSSKGFTLLEVMIALAISGGLIITLLYTLNHHLSITERHETITRAFMLGKEKLAEMRKNPANESGKFDEPFDAYSFTSELKPFPFPGVSEISVHVSKERERISLRELIWSQK